MLIPFHVCVGCVMDGDRHRYRIYMYFLLFEVRKVVFFFLREDSREREGGWDSHQMQRQQQQFVSSMNKLHSRKVVAPFTETRESSTGNHFTWRRVKRHTRTESRPRNLYMSDIHKLNIRSASASVSASAFHSPPRVIGCAEKHTLEEKKNSLVYFLSRTDSNWPFNDYILYSVGKK